MDPLRKAIEQDNPAKISSLLALGADPDEEFLTHRATPLMVAAELGRAEALALMLPYATPNKTDADGNTALMVAARFGEPEAALALIGCTNPNAINDKGLNAFWIAFSKIPNGSVPFAKTALICANLESVLVPGPKGESVEDALERIGQAKLGLVCHRQLECIKALALSARESQILKSQIHDAQAAVPNARPRI